MLFYFSRQYAHLCVVCVGCCLQVRSIYDGLFKESGLYNTTPEGVELAKLVDEAKVLASDRAVYAGATDLSTGLYSVFDKTTDSAINAALASSAVPGGTLLLILSCADVLSTSSVSYSSPSHPPPLCIVLLMPSIITAL